MTDLGICIGCGAPILWARSAETGKPMMLDREPVADGGVRLNRGAVGAVGGFAYLADVPLDVPGDGFYPERYRPHSSTCSRGVQRREGAA